MTFFDTKIVKIFFYFPFPTEDPQFKECEGSSPMSKWEINVGWQ
jgi:hypothetical protein